MIYLVFDVESDGLHGEGFAVGWCVVGHDGETLADGIHVAPLRTPSARNWVLEHVMPVLPARTRSSTVALRTSFWELWADWRDQGAQLAADVPWPVEARFLLDCIRDEPERGGYGPYPLIDIASVRLGAGLDPLADEPRLASELPHHNPLADARQSARLLLEALKR